VRIPASLSPACNQNRPPKLVLKLVPVRRNSGHNGRSQCFVALQFGLQRFVVLQLGTVCSSTVCSTTVCSTTVCNTTAWATTVCSPDHNGWSLQRFVVLQFEPTTVCSTTARVTTADPTTFCSTTTRATTLCSTAARATTADPTMLCNVEVPCRHQENAVLYTYDGSLFTSSAAVDWEGIKIIGESEAVQSRACEWYPHIQATNSWLPLGSRTARVAALPQKSWPHIWPLMRLQFSGACDQKGVNLKAPFLDYLTCARHL
jgi:hypothetical protein